MKFSDIIGQSVLVNSLKRAVEEDKVANGYIFCGPKGCGKKLTAFVFASALNCKGADREKPCEVCSSCIKFINGNHPNIEIVKPTGATIKIKQMRDIISEVSKTSLEAGFKVIIIDNAEKMTHEAQDAFLKTLEEPPQNTVFLLLTENQHSLLPTIVSRCQVYNIKRISNNDMERYLKNHYKLDEDKVKLATAHSNGIIGRAVQILQDNDYINERNLYIKTIKMLFEGNYNEASMLVSDIAASREAAEGYTDFALSWFRDIMVLWEAPDAADDIVKNIDMLDELENIKGSLTKWKLYKIIDIIKDTLKQIKQNVSFKNSLECMILNILEVSNGKDSWGKV